MKRTAELRKAREALADDAADGRAYRAAGWTMVTSGRVVCAIRGDVVDSPATLPGPVAELLRPALAFEGGADTDVATFHAFLLANQGRRTCPRCDGKREVAKRCSDCDHEHTHACPECGGDGHVVDADRPARVCGYPTSAWRLSLVTGWLLKCGVGHARIGLDETASDVPLLVLDAGDLRGVSTVFSPEARARSGAPWPPVSS